MRVQRRAMQRICDVDRSALLRGSVAAQQRCAAGSEAVGQLRVDATWLAGEVAGAFGETAGRIHLVEQVLTLTCSFHASHWVCQLMSKMAYGLTR